MRRHAIVLLLAPLTFYFACKAGNDNREDDDGGNTTVTDGSGGDGGMTGSGGDMGSTMESSSSGFDPQTTSTGSGVNCDALPDEDKDMDGFTINQGDCNDCDANVNPNAIEVIGESGLPVLPVQKDGKYIGVISRKSLDQFASLNEAIEESEAGRYQY